MVSLAYITITYCHCKSECFFSPQEWLPWLQTSWRGGSCEKFTLVLETNCIRQLERKQA